jgi:hypothetical protein
MYRVAFLVAASLSIAASVSAHHGGGTFDGSKEIKLTGTFTRLDLVNPHSWIYFDVARPDGKVDSYRCEMRSATVLRRSGWRPEMFKKGERLTFEGSPDRNDPRSCYLNTIVFEDGKRVDRYGQLTKGPALVATRATRAPRRPTGEPNISGDWAPEQLVMTDPRGRRGALVPLSRVNEFKPGEGRIGGPPGAGRGAGPRIIQGAQLTAEGERGAPNSSRCSSRRTIRACAAKRPASCSTGRSTVPSIASRRTRTRSCCSTGSSDSRARFT